MSTDYNSQHPEQMPADMQAYKRTPEFTLDTLPSGLKKEHSTKAGVWAYIHVLEGEIHYRVPDWQHEEIIRPGKPGLVAPRIGHWVTPLSDTLRMYVEFYSNEEQGKPHEQDTGVS